MSRLTTHYLGLTLDSPLVPSASPLTRQLKSCHELVEAGAPALVMHSLFEEDVKSALSAARGQRLVERHLNQLMTLKRELGIPIIASLNGSSLDAWVDYGTQLQQAGADALEINIYFVAADAELSPMEVEYRYLGIIGALKQKVALPITVKLSAYLSSPVNMVKRCREMGAEGVVLFNRFYQPVVDLETLSVVPQIQFSSSTECAERIRWAAIIRGQVDIDLALTGGINRWQDVARAIAAGADVTHLCSLLLQQGPDSLRHLRRELLAWMDDRGFESLEQFRGIASQKRVMDPAAWERVSYLKVLDAYE
ncbi:dihydroorotate dehydrogenase-like protein [Aestuariirhabdus litorea]|uniref:Dihydroorotate dehydrogenase-like protein n=1 Tax=Aestuariirhabdus litorea TaxID=2528527 RepID=A0A3P3VL86_9GAMM|nr:dihydroorotate dehydrogenase-like protein [Aestuariirhabdus litorea]RRJ82486.1 dihydroorotate dehydrogenase-like protein [Aestuariirhabdus litorea]RWW92647.1 dihydroorotate dehydrogenase-like protein [Endozoicomonadaceae bacterium GTF-13]